MKKVFVIAIILAAAAEGAVTYTNPVIPSVGPADPTVICYKGKYYLYPTGNNRSYDVYISNDLVSWVKGTKVFAPGLNNVWAPDVFYNKQDKKFYLYYTANFMVGVAVADKPDGAFVNRGYLVSGAIDAHFFEDTDEQYYLYFVINGVIYVQKMSTPLELIAGTKIAVQSGTAWWEGGGTEGPWMLKHNGIYYLIYSGNAANTVNYAVGYATSSSPTGPFTKYAGNPIIHSDVGVYGPGHGSVTKDSDGNMWHVYHQKQDTGIAYDRFICIDPMWFDGNGVLHSVATRGTAQPAPTVRNVPATDCDCDVDMYDFSVLARAWLSSVGEELWDPNCDISEPADGVIDELDLAVMADNWLAGK